MVGVRHLSHIHTVQWNHFTTGWSMLMDQRSFTCSRGQIFLGG